MRRWLGSPRPGKEIAELTSLGFLVRKRILKIGLRASAAFLILVVVFVIISLLVIDRGEPQIVGNVPASEVESIRRSVRSIAIRYPFHWLSSGEFSAAWYFTKETYTYRILSIEQIDTNVVFVYTTTNTYPSGLRRPSFAACKTNGVWEAALNTPIL
jgi:hypothetical protein